ncbi:MAG: hypothetical protein AVDCRST_MAG56-2885, partial [uncultured Cytophagales bacterium]
VRVRFDVCGRKATGRAPVFAGRTYGHGRSGENALVCGKNGGSLRKTL